MTKEQIIETVRQLPDGFELDDLFERLLLIRRIEEGIRQSESGETVGEAEARTYLNRWLVGAGAAVSR
ncbi:hypothetical protein [uncultured Hymenobacter sp.]|uniref:hypothetical protein n=1 Tax=uncultured Hymenobacter sp. TaxID=170016 RepID=UPI0035C999DF